MLRVTVGESPSCFSTRERLRIRPVRRTRRSWPGSVRAVMRHRRTPDVFRALLVLQVLPDNRSEIVPPSSMHPIVASMTGSVNHGLRQTAQPILCARKQTVAGSNVVHFLVAK